MFKNHAALAIALSLLTEKDKTDKSVFSGRYFLCTPKSNRRWHQEIR